MESISSQLSKFLENATVSGAPVALVTSGGTTVPLEKNTVRYLDNFSTGKRGAACTEYLLSRGYAVCLLQRRGALAPYLRHLQPEALFAELSSPCSTGTSAPAGPTTAPDTAVPSTRSGARRLEGSGDGDTSPPLTLTGESARTLAGPVREYQKVMSAGMLLTIPFTTVDEYLNLLEVVSCALSPLGAKLTVILAAAVSDFYLPPEEMSVHKMASSTSELVLTLKPVRKVVGILCKNWCPKAFVVTFKLETDETVLLDRARAALERYGHSLVVANQLQTRYDSVAMVTNDAVDRTTRPESGEELEVAIVEDLARRHAVFIAQNGHGRTVAVN